MNDSYFRCTRCKKVLKAFNFQHQNDPNKRTKICIHCRKRLNLDSRRNARTRKSYEWKIRKHYQKIMQSYWDKTCDCGLPFAKEACVILYRKDGNRKKHLRRCRSIKAMNEELANYESVCLHCHRNREHKRKCNN